MALAVASTGVVARAYWLASLPLPGPCGMLLHAGYHGQHADSPSGVWKRKGSKKSQTPRIAIKPLLVALFGLLALYLDLLFWGRGIVPHPIHVILPSVLTSAGCSGILTCQPPLLWGFDAFE